MKANAKYTALEILQVAGVEKPEEKIGKTRVRIAGVAGIVKPNHLIKIQPETTEIEIIVGIESKKITLEKGEAEPIISKAAKLSIEAKGKEVTKKAEALAKAKAVARAKPTKLEK